MTGLKEAAAKIRAERNKKWRDSWDEWERVTFIDHIIAKLKRACNCPAELRECLIDAYNYAMELGRRLPTGSGELALVDIIIGKLKYLWAGQQEVEILSFAAELKRRLLMKNGMKIKEWQKRITYDYCIPHGFDWKPEDIDTMLLRIGSEVVGEAPEAARDNDIKHLGEELADTFIRLANCAEVMGIDLEKEIEEKHQRNMKRPYLHGRGRK